jgi:hypothetical protein
VGGLNILFRLEILVHSGLSISVPVLAGAFQASSAEIEQVMPSFVVGICRITL